MATAPTAPLRLGPHSLVDPPSPSSRSRGSSPTDPSSSSFREILACIDGSELAGCVLAHAHAVALSLGARLTLLHVLETPAGDAPADPLDWGIRQREARARLDQLAARVDDLKSGVRAELIQGRAAEQICGWADRHEVDLTILCSHGARGVTDWDLASTARKLIDRTPGSVLLVPAAAAATTDHVRYRKILVPLDGSPRAESVLPIAMRIAAVDGAELVLVHVVPVPEITRSGARDAEGSDLERKVVEHNRRVAEVYLDRLRARVSQAGAHVRARIVGGGNVRSRLASLIDEEHADLVVMSAHGRGGRTDSPCGSVAEHAITHATVPLLIVRERRPHRMRRVGPTSARTLDPLAPSSHANS